MYFLDTNTCIYFLNGKFESVKTRILATPPNKIAIPVVVKAELLLGAFKSRRKNENLAKVEKFLDPFTVVPFSDPVCRVYAEIRQKAEKSGKIIGPNDLFIAAIVKFHDGILVSNNLAEFSRIEGLRIENWVEA